MAPGNNKAFSQVKSILGKLDRSIDELRARRTTPLPAPSAPVVSVQPTPIPQQQPVRPTSQFGRATPLPPYAR